jgi:excisionase family DNA binding protein
MTRPRLAINPVLVFPGRRRRGAGEPAPLPVPSPADEVVTDGSSGDGPWLLDSREVAVLLGLGRTKVCQMIAKNELPVIRIGRCVRVSRQALRVWVGEHLSTSHYRE